MPPKQTGLEYPEVLKDLADQIADFFVESGQDPMEAARIGFRAAEHIREKWGGGKIYIPKAKVFVCAKRDREISERFTGQNAQELCREYEITESRLYQIVNAVRRQRQGSRQSERRRSP